MSQLIKLIKQAMGARDDEDFLSQVKNLVNSDPSLLEKTDKNGATALHCAGMYGPYKLVKLLIDLGANKNARTHGDLTPFELSKARWAPSAILDILRV